MNFSVALLMLALTADRPPMSPQVERAMTSWTLCQRQTQFLLAAGPGTPESIAADVMRRCEGDEKNLRAAWEGLHADAPSSIRDLREQFRMSGILQVRELRAGAALANPIQAWSSCIGAHSVETSADEPPEQAAERAVNSCKPQEDALVGEAERKLGAEHAPGVRSRFRRDAREGIVRLISDCRAHPQPPRPECLASASAD